MKLVRIVMFVAICSIVSSTSFGQYNALVDDEPVIVEESGLKPVQAPVQIQKNVQAPIQKNVQAPIQKSAVQKSLRADIHAVLPFRERRLERRRARLEQLD